MHIVSLASIFVRISSAAVTRSIASVVDIDISGHSLMNHVMEHPIYLMVHLVFDCIEL